MAALISGATSNVIAETDAVTRALHTSQMPPGSGLLGSYSLGTKTGIMAAGLAGASPIFSLRFQPTTVASSLMLVKKILFTASTLGTAFAAGSALFETFVLRSYTVKDTGGGSLTVGTAVTSGKLRGAQGVSGVDDFRISATATLSAGTQTADTNPINSTIIEIPATTTNYAILGPNFDLWRAIPGEHPLVLVAGEGLVIRATVPATGTWSASVQVVWDEVVAYGSV